MGLTCQLRSPGVTSSTLTSSTLTSSTLTSSTLSSLGRDVTCTRGRSVPVAPVHVAQLSFLKYSRGSTITLYYNHTSFIWSLCLKLIFLEAARERKKTQNISDLSFPGLSPAAREFRPRAAAGTPAAAD